MIVLVDQDPVFRAATRAALLREGLAVEGFGDPRTALSRMADVVPDLLLSEMGLAGPGQPEFHQEYARRHPTRHTPLVLLSSRGDEADRIRGLDAGADDCLAKPVSAALLVARVRACLRRARAAAVDVGFHGELERCPFARLVEFCEQQAFTGIVEVVGDGLQAAVPFHGGQIEDAAPDHAALLDRLFNLRRGSFLLRPRLPNFGALGELGPRLPAAGDGAAGATGPVGKLSAVQAGSRQLQVQTEFTTTPAPAVVSVAVLGGRTVLRRSTAAEDVNPSARQRLVHAQHAAVEGEVRGRLASLAARRVEPSPSLEDRRDELIARGLDAYLDGQHAGALASWEAAAALDPAHRALQVNLRVVRRKLGARG